MRRGPRGPRSARPRQDPGVVRADTGAFWQATTGDSRLRWVGPEKGVVHLATAAVVNAVWGLWAKAEGKPLRKLLADLPPERLVTCVPIRYVTDAITPEEALAILRRNAPTKADREAELRRDGYPVHTTAPRCTPSTTARPLRPS